jgi:ankyrin repeat protein
MTEEIDLVENDRLFGPSDKGIFNGIKNPQIKEDFPLYQEMLQSEFQERIAAKAWRNENEDHLLHELAMLNLTNLIELLLKEGHDANVRNKRNRTPLHSAAFWGNLEAAEILIQNKAEVDATGNSGESPLHIAAEHGYVKMVEFLINCGADYNRADDYFKNTAIHFAVQYSRTGVVQLLLEKGVKTDMQNKDGYTPYALAKHTMHIRTQNAFNIQQTRTNPRPTSC